MGSWNTFLESCNLRKGKSVKQGSPVLEFTSPVKFWCLQERPAMTTRTCTLLIAPHLAADQKLMQGCWQGWRPRRVKWSIWAQPHSHVHKELKDDTGAKTPCHWCGIRYEPVSCLLYSLIMLPPCYNCVPCNATQQCRLKSVDGTVSTRNRLQHNNRKKSVRWWKKNIIVESHCCGQLSRTMETDLEAIEQYKWFLLKILTIKWKSAKVQ